MEKLCKVLRKSKPLSWSRTGVLDDNIKRIKALQKQMWFADALSPGFLSTQKLKDLRW
jgi:hypothetical protein